MIPIWLAEPRRRTPEGEEYLSWLVYEQLGIGDLDIEVDIAAGAVSPTLSGIMVFDYERPADQFADPTLRTVMHWLRRVTACGAAFTAASPLTPANFFPSVAGWLHRIHSTDAVVTQKILRNGATPVWNLTTVQAPAIYQPYGLALQNGVFSLALDADTQYVNGLPIQTVPDLAIDFVTSGAATGSQFISIIELRKPFDLS